MNDPGDDDHKRVKAKVFFDRGETVAGTGNYDYAIEMYLQGLALDPACRDGHQALRALSLRRKAKEGRAAGSMERLKLLRPTSDPVQAMLRAEKLLAYDPGNTDYMVKFVEAAEATGFTEVVEWMLAILRAATGDRW